MTRPRIICFPGKNGNDDPEIVIRILLYSTADQGQYIQNMFVRICQSSIVKDFNVWGYGDKGIVRGSGLFASQTGVSAYHHFLLPRNERWNFVAGEYQLEVFVETVNNSIKKIFEQKLPLTTEQSNSIKEGKAVYFDWAPNIEQYI